MSDLELVITALKDEAKEWAFDSTVAAGMLAVAERLQGLMAAAGCFCDSDYGGLQEGCLHPMRARGDGSMICDRCGRVWTSRPATG